jgi:hypothetical protein
MENKQKSVADFLENLFSNLDNKGLTSLEGSPENVEFFDVSCNKLKNLIGGPKKVRRYFAYSNQLESLEGSPEEVSYFVVSYNPTLKNTDGIPKRIGKLYVDGTIRSVSQFTEYPEYVGEIIFDNKISIEDIKLIVSNIEKVDFIYIGDKKYTKYKILKTNKQIK